MEQYVYIYRDPSRGNEPIYVGKGKGNRAQFHLSRTDKHPMTHRVQKMLRENVSPVVAFIASGIDDELACLVEQEAISKFGRKDLGKGPLLNLTDGGEGTSGRVASAALRANMSKAKAGAKYDGTNYRLAALGRTYTEERNAKVSASLKGHPVSAATREKLRAARLNYNQAKKTEAAQ